MAIPYKYTPEELAAFNAAKDKLRAEEAAGAPGTYNAPGEGPIPMASTAPTAKGSYFDKYVKPGTTTGPKGSYFDKYVTPESAWSKAAHYAGQAGTGVIKAGINLLGIPGEIQQAIGSIKGTRGPTSVPEAPLAPTPTDLTHALEQATGQPLPLPVHPGENYLSAATEGMASMMSPRKWLQAAGALSGTLGEAAKQMELPGGRLGGNLAGFLPFIASKFLTPWDVRALGPWVKRIGEGVIDQGGWAANQAARHLGTETTSLANQVPQLGPLYDWAQASKEGAPLAEMNAATKQGIDRVTTLPEDPEVTKALVNAVKRPATRDPLEGMVSDVEEGLRSNPADALKHIPYMPVSAIDNWGHMFPPSRMPTFVEELASPEAHSYLQSLAEFSKTREVSNALAKALLATKLQEEPPLRIDITGGNPAQ